MNQIILFLLMFMCLVISSYAQDNKITEDDIYQAKIARFYAQFNQLFYTKFIFKAAIEEAHHLSKTNDQLLNFANFQMHSVKTAYESLDLDLKTDLIQLAEGKNSNMTIDSLDSLCVANKFIETYTKLKDKSSHQRSEDSKELSNEALSFQTQIENIIKVTDSPLNDIECKKLL